MSAGLWVRDSGGVSRKQRDVYERDVNGVSRKQRELWARDDAGVARKIFSGVPPRAPITWKYTEDFYNGRHFYDYRVHFLGSQNRSLDAEVYTYEDDETWIEGSVYTEYLFDSPLTVTDSDYLTINRVDWTAPHARTFDITISVNSIHVYDGSQMNASTKLHPPTSFPLTHSRFSQIKSIRIYAGMDLKADPPDYYPYAKVELLAGLRLHYYANPDVFFWLTPSGHE